MTRPTKARGPEATPTRDELDQPGSAQPHLAANAETRKREIADALRKLEHAERDVADARAKLAMLVEETPDELAVEYVDQERAAELMHVSVRTVRREIREGRLPARGKRRSIIVKRSDVVAWLDARPLRPVRPVAEALDVEEPDLDHRVRQRLAGGAR